MIFFIEFENFFNIKGSHTRIEYRTETKRTPLKVFKGTISYSFVEYSCKVPINQFNKVY